MNSISSRENKYLSTHIIGSYFRILDLWILIHISHKGFKLFINSLGITEASVLLLFKDNGINLLTQTSWCTWMLKIRTTCSKTICWNGSNTTTYFCAQATITKLPRPTPRCLWDIGRYRSRFFNWRRRCGSRKTMSYLANQIPFLLLFVRVHCSI